MTAADMVIATLAASEAELRELVVIYRLCYVGALHELAEREKEIRRHREYHEHLVEENRALRVQMMRADAKKA